MTELTKDDIKEGHWYRAKRYREGLFGNTNNDRKVIWMSGDKVQYDSDTVKIGQRRPTITIEKFLNWAKRELKEDENFGESNH